MLKVLLLSTIVWAWDYDQSLDRLPGDGISSDMRRDIEAWKRQWERQDRESRLRELERQQKKLEQDMENRLYEMERTRGRNQW